MASMMRDPYYTAPKSSTPTPLANAYNNFGTAVKNQGNDYTDILNRYRNLYDSIGSGGSGAAANFDMNYTRPTYQNTQDYLTGINTARQRAQSGTYSGQDQADIRERGISPIRSVYANAQRNLNRSRSLSGGYSPNYGAVSAKMAREMSSQLSDATTRVNAQLAQDIAGQKERNQTEYLGTAANEQNQRNQFELNAAEMDNRNGMNKLDAQMKDFYTPIQLKLSALGGMNQTYGTTPATANMLGNFALNQGNQELNANQINANNNLRMMQIYGGA